MTSPSRPDVIVIMTDEERAVPPYESDDVLEWRRSVLTGRAWFDDHAVNFGRHYTGSLACVPSRPTIFTGQYPDVHGVTQTDGLGKMHDDTRLRWLPPGEVPTLGHWFRAAGYDTHYDGKWHISHADLMGDDGTALATNDDDGNVDQAAVDAYLAADPLGPYGFSGWVGPEPHGAPLANSGTRRDPLIAARVVAWLEDRYARRRAGDEAARKPFLLVASFVNPHDIVLFPMWAARGAPIESPSPLDPPPIAPAPTADEDLSTKPAAQIAYRTSYPTAYGFGAAVERIYRNNAQQYRDTYYRLHAEVDSPLDRVRRTVTDGGSDDAVIVRTSDHGDLLGAHGGLHQKWYTLYDEATRVPFSIARVGANATTGRSVDDAPTSHVDIVPTLLAAAGIDETATAATLRESFSEVHPLPGRNLMPVVDGDDADRDRPVYLMTRDNMLEGDSGASGLARRLGRAAKPPAPLRIQVPAHVASNFEGVVARVGDDQGGSGHLWKLVRTFDDPATWTEPGVRQLASSGPGGDTFRTSVLPDQWELYDLDADPIEAANRWNDPAVASVFAHLQEVMKQERAERVPERHRPWPYVARRKLTPDMKRPPAPARALRKVVQKLGMHPDDPDAREFDLFGKRALVIATNHATLDIGKPTGVFASEMTVPYYAFFDAGMDVDVASPLGGVIPVDPQSLKPVIRAADDDRFLADDVLREKVTNSLAVGDLDMADYDIVFLAGGWGAAFDLGFSEVLGEQITRANALGKVIGGVCHGPLGLRNAKGTDGRPLVEGRLVSAVTDKQVHELGIESTPQHPETELRALGAVFESATKFRDPLANHWVVDGNLVTGQNQNAGPMVAREMMQLVAGAAERGATS
jgi:arylsulfatase A-like enzyme/putative intracellular protease/amidase